MGAAARAVVPMTARGLGLALLYRRWGRTVTEDEVRRIASAFLSGRFEEFRFGEWMLTTVQEHEIGWSVGYQARAFMESGRVSDSLAGNGLVVVPKSGAEPWVARSGLPVEERIAQGRPTIG